MKGCTENLLKINNPVRKAGNMNRYRKCILSACLISLTLFFACMSMGLVLRPRPKQPSDCSASPRLKSLNIKNIAVLPFVPSKKTETGEYTPPFAQRKHKPIPKYYHLEHDDSVVPDELEKQLLKTYTYKIADRRNLKKILGEIELQQTGLVDDRTLATIGKLTGADAVITGTVNMALAALQWQSYGDIVYAAYIGYVSFQLRMTHVETGEVLWVCSIARNSLNYIDEPITISSQADVAKLDTIGGVAHNDLILFVLNRALAEAVREIQ